MRRVLLGLVLVLLTGLGAAQSATISSTSPASISTVTGQQFPVSVNYKTTGLGSAWSCSLGYVSSSLPTGWSAGSAVSASATGGSTMSISSPTVEFLATGDTSMTLLLECSDGTRTVTDTIDIPTVVTGPPVLSGSLIGAPDGKIEQGTSFTVTFSVANTGSAPTRNARAVIDAPADMDAPDSITLTEAGQDEGVIQAGRSSGQYSVTVDVEDDAEDGTVRIELTSARIGTTDTLEVPVDVNTSSGSGSDGGGSGGTGGFGIRQLPTRAISHVMADLRPGQAENISLDQFGLDRIAVMPGMRLDELTLDIIPVNSSVLPSHPDPVYSGFNMSTTGNASAVDSATITFRVNRSWADAHGGPDAIGLRRYTGSWNPLPTSRIGATDSHYRFSAETPGFSYFTIAAEPSSGGGSGDGGDGNGTTGTGTGDGSGNDGDGAGNTDGTTDTTTGNGTTGNTTNTTGTGPQGDGISWLLVGGGVILLLLLLGGTLYITMATDILDQLRERQGSGGSDRHEQVQSHLEILSREIAEAMEQGRLEQDPALMEDLEEINAMIEAGQYSEAERQMREAEQLLEQL